MTWTPSPIFHTSEPTPLPADQLPRVGESVWLLTGAAVAGVVQPVAQHMKVARIGGGSRLRYYVLVREDGGITTALPEEFYSASGTLEQGFYVVNPTKGLWMLE